MVDFELGHSGHAASLLWGGPSLSCALGLWCRGQCEHAVDDLEERALLPQDEAMCLRESKIFPRRGIRFQAHAVSLIGRQRLELDESPCDVVGALVWKKVADQMATAAGNDETPVLRVVLERSALKRIDFVTVETDDAHGQHATPCAASMIRLASNYERRSEHRSNRLA